MSHLVILSLLLPLTIACGKKKRAAQAAPPPLPCAAGINQSLCSEEVIEESLWTRSFNVLQTDAETGQNKLLNTVNVVQRFSPSNEGPIWERSITLSYPDGRSPETMIVGGKILSVDKESLRVILDYSSCDAIGESFSVQPLNSGPEGRKLYYQRSGESLQIRTRPFVEVKPVPVQGGNIMGQIVGGMVTQIAAVTMAAMLDMMVEVGTELVVQSMTLGHYRDHLKEGAGTYTASDIKDFVSLEQSFEIGQVGCFYAKGEERGKFVTKAEELTKEDLQPDASAEEPVRDSWWKTWFK